MLGSGTSAGIPVIGCRCATCVSSDPRDRRSRASIMLTWPAGPEGQENLVIDTGPDFRAQMLAAGVTHLTDVLYTHTHADHCHGFDDLRAFYFINRRPVTCHAAAEHCPDIRNRFSYAFEETGYIGTKPQVLLSPFGGEPFSVLGLAVEPALVPHGHMQTAAFRFGTFVYATDFKTFPPELIRRWRGRIETMVASGIRYGTHPTHSCIPETLELFADLRVKKGYITHIAHEIMHAVEAPKLPDNIQLAYDGQQFTVTI